MTNTEMDAIQVQDTPVFLKATLSPGVELLAECVVEATDRAGAGSDSHESLGHFSDLVRARASHKHLGEPFCNVGFITAVALKGLRVKLPFTVSGDFHVLKSASRGDQVARVVTVAVAFALGIALSPRGSDERH